MSVDEAVRRRTRYGIPLGLLTFAVIIYFGFIRKETEVDESAMDYLTRDITHRIPQKRNALPIDTAGSSKPG